MTLKILAVAEFDCAGVLSAHRRALRARGVDYRLAVAEIYAVGNFLGADWTHGKSVTTTISTKGDIFSSPSGAPPLAEFAEAADVLQFHPSIGQPRSLDLAPNFDDGEAEPLLGIDWRQVNRRARRVSLFHGSRNAQAHAETYADYWRALGHEVWATTADYAARMRARLAPPAVEVLAPGYNPKEANIWLPREQVWRGVAQLRADGDPLVVVQAPTDPANCQTEVFLSACRGAGAVADLVMGRPHEEVLARKRRACAGFDHLRGAPSVNTIENLALGLAPLCGVSPEAAEVLGREVGEPETVAALFPFGAGDEAGFRARLRELAGDAQLTRDAQMLARDWYERCWTPKAIGAKLEAMYRELLS